MNNVPPISFELTEFHHNFFVGRIELADLIIKNGADVNATDKMHGQTPLHYCIAHDSSNLDVPLNRLEIAKLLIESEANQDISDKYGNTPLQLAIQNGLQFFF